MKLIDWMKKNRWNSQSFSKELGICRLTLKKVMDQKSDLSLRVAMKIVAATNEEVELEDLCPQFDLIRKSLPICKTKERPIDTKKNDIQKNKKK